jgi:hypothetical protein
MRIRQTIVTGALVVTAIAASPAPAALAADTPTTFGITAGGLGVAVPASANLGSAAPGASATSQLGVVTVTDDRAALTAAWTATVTSTSFTTGGATPAETIANSALSYWSGPATATTGTGTPAPGQATSGDAVVLSTGRTAFSWSAGNGNNSATWNPTLIVAVPATAVAGTYSGTVTHSVA